MNAVTAIEVPSAEALTGLRRPFPPHQISKRPKETKAQIDARKADRNLMVFNCPECGGHHHRNATHLNYVGHAALTDRLLDTDPAWSWEPAALTPEGLPAFDRTGGLWIRLTVNGVTRLGYGAADGKSGGDAVKEIIGDALRNAAMRFGAALDLWHKGDLHVEDDDTASAAPASPQPDVVPDRISDAQRNELTSLAMAKNIPLTKVCELAGGIRDLRQMPAPMFANAKAWIERQKARTIPPSQTSDILEDEVPY
jgi:hypothetical protein